MANEKRLIDANEVIRSMQRVMDEENNPNSLGSRVFREIIKGIELTPTVDAVEVVRCEKCQWFNKAGFEEDNRQQAMPELDFGWCSIHHRIMQACMFCSYGERREGE